MSEESQRRPGVQITLVPLLLMQMYVDVCELMRGQQMLAKRFRCSARVCCRAVQLTVSKPPSLVYPADDATLNKKSSDVTAGDPASKQMLHALKHVGVSDLSQ